MQCTCFNAFHDLTSCEEPQAFIRQQRKSAPRRLVGKKTEKQRDVLSMAPLGRGDEDDSHALLTTTGEEEKLVLLRDAGINDEGLSAEIYQQTQTRQDKNK